MPYIERKSISEDGTTKEERYYTVRKRAVGKLLQLANTNYEEKELKIKLSYDS